MWDLDDLDYESRLQISKYETQTKKKLLDGGEIEIEGMSFVVIQVFRLKDESTENYDGTIIDGNVIVVGVMNFWFEVGTWGGVTGINIIPQTSWTPERCLLVKSCYWKSESF